MGPVVGLPMGKANETSAGEETTIDGRTLEECSGRGSCDRTTGTCECEEGRSGTACEMIMCPGSDPMSCSGHGRCMRMSTIAMADDAMPMTSKAIISERYTSVPVVNSDGEDESEGLGFNP